MSAGFPPVAELIPHRGRAVLLSHVVSHAGDLTVCAARVSRDAPYAQADGRVPGAFSIEILAQAVAAHAGLVLARKQATPRIGLLLGVRDYVVRAGFLEPTQALAASARRVWGSEAGLVAFDCELRDAGSGALLARGRLSCYLTDSHVGPEAGR